jgi:predicted secreted acid phosphatase
MKTAHATESSYGWVAYIQEDGVTVMTISNRIFDSEKEAVDHARNAIEKGIYE